MQGSATVTVSRIAPTLTTLTVTPAAPAAVVFPPGALQAAEDNPRLLIDEPGWKATHVYGFAEQAGTIAFDNGGRQLEMNWYPADQYDGYYKDRLEVSAPEPVEVDGRPGDVFTYSAGDFAVMLRPRDGAFVELRTGGGGWTRAEFDRVLGRIAHVDVQTWLAALPAQIVTQERAMRRWPKCSPTCRSRRASIQPPRGRGWGSTTPTSSAPR